MVSSSAVLIRTIALALVAAVLVPATARAATFTVTTTLDDPAVTGCTPVACTIRSALDDAAGNGTAEDDVIVVPAGTYTLDVELATLTVPTGATRIRLEGAGAGNTVIQPDAEFPARVLAVGSNAGITLSDLTLRNGVASSAGGNLLQLGDSSVALERVRVTGGGAPQGGGIAVSGGGGTTTLRISQSLIDDNTATGTQPGTGGGLSIAGATSAATVTVTDSTIFNNTAANGAGVAVSNNSQQPPAFRGVTLAGNNARAGQIPGFGGIYSPNAPVRFQGSIVAGNTRTINVGNQALQQPANCSITPAATDEGGNVTPDNDCGLSGVHADPQLATALDGSQPPVLTIPANSSAVDVADCAGRTQDQRGVARPQLNACDAGAYEYQPPPPEPTPTPSPVPTATPTPTPTPRPVADRSVLAEPVKGKVLVKLKGQTKFVPLTESVIENGAEVDTRDGVVELTRSDGGAARFYDGIFRISQSGGITTLTLTEKLAPCPRRRARIAARKPKTRKLWGDGKGKFRTKGQYAAATVRGTKWRTEDGCRYTRIKVAAGSVNVRDAVKKKTIILRRGKTYTARAKR